jgi:microcin C transport system permease protein
VLTLFGWMGLTFYVRGEFYREKAKDYVAAAVSMGANDRTVIFRHILPNALTPIISFAPFAVVGYIGSLVSLDYLGFGLPPPTPSWGQLVQQGMQDIFKWWLVFFPLGALFVTLLLVVFIGEAVREAFDPKVFSRLR